MKLLTPEEIEKALTLPIDSRRRRMALTIKVACELIARIYPGRPYKNWKDALRALGESHED